MQKNLLWFHYFIVIIIYRVICDIFYGIRNHLQNVRISFDEKFHFKLQNSKTKNKNGSDYSYDMYVHSTCAAVFTKAANFI